MKNSIFNAVCKTRYLALLVVLILTCGNVWADVTDVITASDLEATGTTYTDFSGVSITSDAVYAGQSAKDARGNIQLRSKNSNSGIVSTTSGGKVKSVKITVASGSNTVNVYGSNTAYTAASDLYNSSKQGTLLGNTSSTGTITVTGDYAYVGIRSSSGAIYLSKVEITWSSSGGSSCDECTYYVYNGTTWVSIGTTGFDDVVLAPPTLPDNNHGAGNGCWTTDKDVFTSCTYYASGDKFRFVPNPGGADPTAVNKPGSGTCELYAVYAQTNGCLSTTVTAVQCARIWEEPDNLAVSSVSSTGATLSWDAIDGVSSYHVIVTKVSNSSTVFDGDVSGTSKSLTGLTSGTEYSWKVAANSATNDACDSNFSDGDNFTTCASGFTSLTPTVTADNIGKNGGEALFELSGATSYSVTLKNNSTNAVISGYNNVSNTSGDITFSGLTASTTYRVEVTAHNACGDDSQTGSDTFTTDAATLYTVTFHNAAGSAPSAVTQTTENGTVSIPSASACDGWTFVGWKIGGAQSSTTTDPTSSGTWITNATWPKNYTPSGNIDAYAVFSKTEGGSTPVTDVLNQTLTGVTGTSYTAFSGKTATSDAVYAGTCAGGNSSIQLRTNNGGAGVIMTASGGNVTKVKVEWNSNTTNGRTLNIYGKNTAYSSYSDLSSSDASTQGSLLGSIVCGTSTELDITGNYAYIGFKSSSGAMYLTSVTITIGGGGTTTWRSDPPCSTAKLDHITITTPPTTTNYLVGQVFSSAGAVVTAYYDDDSYREVTASWTPTTPLTAGTGQTATASYTEGGVTKTATTTINVYAVTLLKKDNTGATISGALNETPAVSVSVAALSAAASGNQYVFKEWQISGGTLGSSAETASNTIATVTGPVTVTAVYWKPITVKWYVNGSQYGATGTYSYGWNVQYPASPAPESVGCTGKVFIGWSRTSMYRNDTKPTDLVESGESLTSNENFYAIFADKISDGTPPTWTKTALGSVSAGTYLICMSDGKVFNGNISSGHGQVTSSVFATSLTSNTTINEDAPAGACEVTFAAVTNGFTMNVPGKGYLYAKGTKTGNLDYHETESEYWFSANSFWRYHGQNTSGTYVALYDYAHTQFKNSVTTSGTDVHEIILLKKTNAGVPATYSDYTTSCTCSEYQFHYQHNSSWNTENICFSPVAGATNNYLTEEMALPYAEWYKVTWQGNDQSYTAVKGFAGTTDNIPMPFYHNRGKSFGVAPQNGNIGGGKGRFHVYHDSGSTNKYVSFVPTGYTLNFGTGDTWTNDLTLNFTGKTSNWDETEWYTDIVTLTDAQIGKKIFVGLQTETGYVWCDPYSQKDNLSGLRTKSGSGENWVTGGMSTSYPNKTGKFRIYANSGDKNWYVTFVPYYHLVYDANGGSGAPAASEYVSCEETAANRTIAISATEPTRANYRFMGWATSTERAAAGTVDYKYGTANNSIVLTGEQTLYAVWKQEFTVTYNYAGGSADPECAGGSYIEGEAVTVCASTPTKAGSDFNGWSYSPSVTVSAGAFTMPASNVVITATWTDHTYVLNHSGSNYTNTENQTTIKSGDTPLTLHYTCAGTYGFPNSISISGGGKSWTVGTDYTWTVAADKKSATLVINATTITADVTISITMSTLYTVTYVHHDKGIFSGASTTESVRSDDNVITLPTVTSVSCGFYDTFEGWIASGSEYSESTSKPATVYAGGSSYTVQGDVTLRALYSKCEGDGGSVYRKVTAIGDVTNDGTYILVSNAATPTVYSGHTESKDYGDCITGLSSDGSDYSSSLPSGAVQVTATRGTGDNANKFSLYNGTKYIVAGTSTGTSDSPSWWQLTNGSNVNNKTCPANVLQPASYTTYVLQENNTYNRYKTYTNSQTAYVFLYKLIDKCTKYYGTNPSCVKPVGVHIVYNANAGDATMSCNNHNRTYKVQDEVNQYPKLASAYSFCTDATRDGYTLVGWNTQTNGLGTTYELGTNYSNLPVSGELDDENWVTLNVYAMWAPAVKFNLGNATGGTGVPDVVEADGGFMLPTPTAAQLGTIPCDYTFYAWSESSVTTTTTKPAVFLPGTKYTGDARTLYAVYRKGEAGSNPDLFSLSYTIGATKYYVGAVQDTREERSTKFNAVTDAEQATVFGMKSINGQTYKSLYWMNDETREYMYWKDNGAGFQFTSTEDDYYGWNISGTTTLSIASVAKGGYASRTLSGSTTEIGCPSTPNAATSFTKEEATSTTYTYDTNPTCFTTATFQFVTNGGIINNPTAYTDGYYTDITIGEDRYLPTATYPGEWTFEGWMKGSEVADTDMRPESADFIEVTLNTTTYTASTVGTTYFYAVYSKTVNDKQFDPVNGGTYKLFTIMADGTTKKYMPVWGGTQTTLSPVTSCASTGDYTITPGTGEHVGQYKITHGTYTLGVVGEDDTKFKNVADAWWDIEPSTSGKGTWRIKIHGSSTRCMALSGTGYFSNTIISNFVDNPSQTTYRDMEIGECIYTEYTSTPENIPYITITGSPVKITSTEGERVYASSKIHVEAHNFTGVRTIHLSATNGFATNPASVKTAANGAYSGDVDVYYQPTTVGDGSIVSSVLTAEQTAGTTEEQISQTFSALQGRNMPAKFVIAAKIGGQWYAMPDDKTTTETMTALPIEVNDADAPTSATLVPHNVEWSLSDVVNSNDRPKDKVYFYESNKMKDDGVTPWNYALYAGTAPTIGTYGQVSGISGSSSPGYEWGLTTSDLCAYTIGNANVNKNISINTAGTFGTHASGIVSSTLYLLPITAYYETAAMQVLEWKNSSVVVMYTGTQTTATTKIGDNSASGSQTLASQKLTHGIYELTTEQALTANAGAALKVSFGGGAEMAIVTIPIIINSDVTADADHTSEDVIIVSGGKLSAASDKYSFHNIYVYGGGKLKIASGSQLGVNNIILRAGGVTTNGSGGSATYAYTYPQVELGGTLTSTQTNIKYEYITDYDHWYQLCLPFDGTLSSITYPQEYYGDNVTAANTGSWIIKRYAGEVRATGSYDAWKNIENEGATSVTAGHGYIFWGAPKKVSVGGAAKQRQQWGIQRITMPITAATAMTAENADKTITGLSSYSEVAGNSGKVNDQGWNLIGNPYLTNLTGLNSESLITGKLVEELDPVTEKWTGRWVNNDDGVRYVTIPSEHFDTYEAQTMASFTTDNPMKTGCVFFVQIEDDATGVTFATAKRASLMPALFARTEQKIDVETGIVLSDESKHDEVNFWIKDGKTEAYEYNADYPKTMNTTNFNIYGVHSNGELSWVAISPEIAESSMAIGYQVPAAGDYMLSLSETYVSDEIEHVFVTDHGVSPEVTTDLMEEDYNFYVNQAETNDVRFTVAFKLKVEDPGTTTNVENTAGVDSDKPLKFIYNDKMYILRNGIIYDAVGKKVK